MGYKRKKLTHVHRQKSAKRAKKSDEKSAVKLKNHPPDRFPPVSTSLPPPSSSSSEEEEEEPFMKLVLDLIKDPKRAHSDGETEEDSEPEDEEAGEEYDDSGEAEEEDGDEESGSDVADEEAGSDVVGEEEEEVGSDAGASDVGEEEDEEEAGSVEADEDEREEEEAGSDVADEEEAGNDVADEEEEEAGSDEEEEGAGSDVADEEKGEVEEAGSDVEEEEGAGSDEEEGEDEEAGSDVADEEEAGSDVADVEEEEGAGSDEEGEDEGAGSDEEEGEDEGAGSDVADEEEAGSDVADEEEAGSDVADEEEAGSDVADEEDEGEDEEAGSAEGDEEEASSAEADEEEEGKDESGAEEDENDADVNSADDDEDDDVLAESDGSDDSCASENDSDCDSNLANNLENSAMPDGTPGGKDPFIVHFEQLIPESSVKKLEAGEGWQKKITRTNIGKCLHVWNCDNLKANIPKLSKVSFEDLHIKKRIPIENLKSLVTDDEKGVYSASQVELFLRMYSYQDIYYSEKTYKNQNPIEMAYCLHVLNHTLKSRLKVTANNLKQKAAACRDGTEEYPDQGITRPKVLIIVPFRETARRIISNFIKILTSDKSQTDNKKRFFAEYSSQDVNNFSNKPEDYAATFAGNIDDHFKIGLGISQKKLQIYTKFYSSDIIIGSPLGLRSVIGETQSKKEFDFLSSIEILILDQTDIFLMQNWEHILYIMDHLHLQPRDSHGCDFSRVRAWALNSWNKYYRQTLILSSLISPPINVLFNKYSLNYAGKLMLCPNTTDGSICQVALQIPMIFHRIECSSYSQSVDVRFNTFIKKILPKYRGASNMNSTMIFIPSYFDFVRIRNYFIKNEIDFLQISEYSKRKDIAGTRSRFFLGKTNFLLYTERHHFYFRTRLRGIRHIIFYELPLYPHFFSEICNLINDVKLKNLPKDDATGSILYSKYDVQRLAAVVGTNRSSLMIQSPKPVHMFVTEP